MELVVDAASPRVVPRSASSLSQPADHRDQWAQFRQQSEWPPPDGGGAMSQSNLACHVKWLATAIQSTRPSLGGRVGGRN
jgi:hypothetical protein